MKNVDKTNEQLLAEVKSLRHQINQLKKIRTELPEKEPLKNALTKSQQHQKETTALLEAARAIMIHQNFQNAAQAIFDTCKKFTGATSGYVALLSNDGAENEVLFLDPGGLPCTVDESLPMPIRGLRGEAYRTGKTVYDNNFSKSEWMKFMPEGHVTLDNVMFAPLLINGKAAGLLGLANKPGGFTENDARLVSTMGEFASAALHNSRAVESLAHSEERFRSVAETAIDAIVSIDSQGNIIVWNHAAEKIFGYTAEEMTGMPLTTIMPERFREAHKSSLNRVASGGKPRIIGKTVEIVGLRRDKSEFPIELSLAQWKTGEGVFLTAVIRDISERKQAEEELNVRAQLIDAASDSIFVHDFDGNIIYVNEVTCQSRGYTKEELMKMNIRELAVPEYAKAIEPKLSDFLKAGEAVFEFGHFRKDKSIMPVEIHSHIIESGGRKLVLGIARDITERKQMMDSLIITDRLAALGNMAGGFAHELNNPLTSVIGYSQLLLDRKDLSEDVRNDLVGIYEEAQRAAEVIKDFMVFALKQPQPKQPFDINDLIKDVLKLRKHEQRKNNITVNTGLDPELPLVTVGPTRMRQVFLDIVTNAEYFMFEAHEKGTLTITTEKAGEVVRASFSDDGPGIPSENLGQIFNPFFTTKEVGHGIGLGLSICHGIVTEHGGKIYVKSELDKGSTFVVELPIDQE